MGPDRAKDAQAAALCNAGSLGQLVIIWALLSACWPDLGVAAHVVSVLRCGGVLEVHTQMHSSCWRGREATHIAG